MLPLFTTGNFLMLSCNCQVTCSFPWDVSALRTGTVSALSSPCPRPHLAWRGIGLSPHFYSLTLSLGGQLAQVCT